MPKHTRNSSSSHSRYGAPMPVNLAPSPLYSQQRMSAVQGNYYSIPTTSASSMALQAQAQVQQPNYDSYATSTASAVSVPPPVQHRASSGAWTPQDDQQLLSARMQGLNWGQIQANFFQTKTPNACRKRHERLMERKGSDDWDNQKLQRLAREYMSMRKEIWSGLAARTGEKWNVVEQKCMSNGLKNLQSAARAAARRDRLESGGALSGYDDDSGISGMGLTPVDELDASYSSPETTSSVMHSAHSSTASAAATYQAMQQQQQHRQQQQPHTHMTALGANPAAYGLGAYGAGYGGHGYSSSVSSTASAGHGYGAHAGNGHSQGNSPYLSTHRPQSSDMTLGAIINRPRGGPGV
ncbi:hypothetical protein BGZ61DRAFT_372837 [Ilyonectria robusta]|uniref:uncharacterized protein n=1 Tax=Ilyonectria robusta TaxID=1079257 RepID=UPI001E8EB45D|nr:uncharacterized protein BGZ61DRAFT_372837 [Ilyonectria robusta]KAH8655968.1 hypothetical protein BGZ61DRAFT_372837 [Ilyonectria robusta]